MTMSFIFEIKKAGAEAIKHLYQEDFDPESLLVNETKPGFDGDYTLVLFPLLKILKMNPGQLGKELGDFLMREKPELIGGYNMVKGFLNITLSEDFLREFLHKNYKNKDFGLREWNGKKVMVEFSSPNTNKPLHLGHLRNIFLGHSYSKILEACGYKVIKANLVNDRGIHICRSMVAWLHYGEEQTPDEAGMKGDHFVGKFYVKFNEVYQQQITELVDSGMKEKQAKQEAPLQKEAVELLVKWERGDMDAVYLWNKMNGWVFDGFEESYRQMGVSFDKIYRESETYLLGKDIVKEGLESGQFFKKANGSVWIDLTEEGLDEKLLLRADGTSVYMTQDLGTAQLKYDDYEMDQSIYVIGDEQNYHMKVLKLILKKLGKTYADGIYHLSYGMVELPNGKMKSREGTVVDADELMTEMIQTARKHTEELGKVKEFSEEDLQTLYETLGLGAMKYYLLRVDPKKGMVFNPEKSIDFHGVTAPFIQYTHARIKSIFRKENVTVNDLDFDLLAAKPAFHALEKKIVLQLEIYPQILMTAVEERNPSVVAGYCYDLAKIFNTFYRELSVSQAESKEKKQLRLQLCGATAQVIKKGMGLLGIRVPDQM